MPWLEKIVADKPSIRRGSPIAYLLAVAFVGIALWLRLALGNALLGNPVLTFWPAVVGAAYVGGLGPGLLAVALGAVCAWFALVPPRWSFEIESPSDILALTLYVIISVLFCLIIATLHAALDRLRQARQSEQDAAATLERRVAERTEELDVANQQLRAAMAERERAEEQARQSQKLEVVGQLAGGVAHDFNNLLTVIIGYLDQARRRLDGREPEVERQIAFARRGAEGAASLTHRLLAFSRLQALAPVALDVNKLVGGMSDLIRRTTGERIDIEIVLAGGLWPSFCDPNQLEMALLNLIINARDAMPSGGKLTIETANAHLDEEYAHLYPEVKPGQYVMLAMTDTGLGMDEETRQRAFEPFFTTKEIGQGTGLGLSMVFGFAKQSGGHVNIYSEPNQGTSVKLYLPRHMGASPVDEPAARMDAPVRGQTECVILVVEDDAQVREFVTHSLRDLDYTVYEAADGPSALEIVKAEPRIDLLFTDVGLPKMNGRVLAANARRLRPGLRVLFTTAYARNAIVHGGMLDADVALLPKPFTADALARKVAEVLSDGDRGAEQNHSLHR